jgi:hypothetical protein
MTRILPRPLLFAAGLLVAGCAVPPPEPIEIEGLHRGRFTRVNFRASARNVLSASSFLRLERVIPLHTPATVTFYSIREIRVRLGETDFTLVPHPASQTFPVAPEEIEPFLARYFIDAREQLNVDALGPTELKEQVLAGTHRVAMTKEQVYACLGPPARVADDRPAMRLTREEILRHDTWIYPDDVVLTMPTYVQLHFGDGRLQRQVP